MATIIIWDVEIAALRHLECTTLGHWQRPGEMGYVAIDEYIVWVLIGSSSIKIYRQIFCKNLTLSNFWAKCSGFKDTDLNFNMQVM